MQNLFDAIHWTDAERARRDLAGYLEGGRPEVLARLQKALESSPDPQQAALGLGKYLECCGNAAAMLERMDALPELVGLLATVFAQSHFLADILFRNPAYGPWLAEEASLDRARTRDELYREFLSPPWGFDSFDSCFLAMRRFRQREILRIATRDLARRADLVSVTEDLSNLADAMMDAALAGARPELLARYGAPLSQRTGAEATFSVLAMGKLGGRELNFSSDIDLLFLYSDEGQTAGGTQAPIENFAFFSKLGERAIKALSEPSPEGFLFRVDMRLRPFGRSGALASGMETALEYYATYGRAWERQAFIKARASAGDRESGQAFLERIRPFVFPKFFDDATLEDIRGTKQLAEAQTARQGQAGREVKLGPGGIRDIEFTVQMLQLLNGGRWEELRTANTLEAIRVLGRSESLGAFDAETLSKNYTFLRQVEHRLQIEDGRQCHTLPEDVEKVGLFARRLGYKDADSFLQLYRLRTAETRKVLDRFLAAKGGGHLWVGDLINPFSEGEAGLEKLVELGFKETARARRELLALATGDEARPFLRHVHQQFAAILPFLLDALAQTAHPDAALGRLGQVISQIRAPGTLYELLRMYPALCEYLVVLADNSEYLCRILVREPGLFDLLGDAKALDTASSPRSLQAELRALQDAFDPQAALYRLRDGEMLRVAMRELGRRISVAEVGDELTQLAETILRAALAQARTKTAARFGACEIPFAILGLGKFGGWEMGYGSDLDLLFVYEAGHSLPQGTAPSEYFAAVAANTIQTLKEHTRNGQLYDIDTRLRPDGNKGILAIDHEHLADYFGAIAQPWERLALMKARAVAGDRAFALEVERIAKQVAFPARISRAALEHIDDLRRRAQAQTNSMDLKRWEGGISDVEFATRFMQLAHAPEWPELKRGDVLGALDIMRDYELEDRERCQALRRAYSNLRRILNRVRMMDGGKTMCMPDSEAGRADLAARVGIEENLLEFVDRHRQAVAGIYHEVYAECWEAAE